jgi:hypothetical protein
MMELCLSGMVKINPLAKALWVLAVLPALQE